MVLSTGKVKGSNRPSIRAKLYRKDGQYTVVVVEDGQHRFYTATTQQDAEALVRLVVDR